MGNVILAKHFYQKYGPNMLRYLFLNSHYNQVINFNEKLLQQSQDYTQKIKNLLKRLKLYFYWQKKTINQQEINKNNQLYQEIIQSLSTNLNTVKAIYYLDEIIYCLNKELDRQNEATNLIQELAIIFYFALEILGFKFELVNYDLKILTLLYQWKKLRQNKNFVAADQIRKQLQEADVI